MTKLTSGWRKALLAVHIAAAVGVFGSDLALLVLALSGLYPSALLIAQWLVEPLAVTALATGVLLATSGPHGLTHYWWTAIKLAITVALTGAVFLVLAPALTHASDGAGSPPPVTLVLAPALATVLLLTNIALAVFKPAATISRRRIPTVNQNGLPT